ncbi:YfiR family protein [Paludibaculum fermentans]|uniref:YfiR family protein n=1 Tax=Paludibaculum fermentans TaxID=1473598 RepID=UPI003EBEF3BC
MRVLSAWAGTVMLVYGSGHPASGEAMAVPGAEEMEVKAAFVLNFLRLVNWESIPGEENATTLSICTLGPSEFGAAVRSAAKDKVIGNRTVAFKGKTEPDVAHCRVLLVDGTQYEMARGLVRALGHQPVLTIGNGAGFVQIGGMFELVVGERKVQFDTNLQAVRASRLDVSARLLNLSRNLRKGANGVD